ncbi:DivIVA domain-containing protein [Nocardia blacklockiae]|uniref:DivIVA domain-containing protein n=1 Tax=Nocardia blacklockiae TaxID=480036 RepID=UPI003F696BFA
MLTLLLYVLIVGLVAALLFLVAAAVFGRGEELGPLPEGTTATVLPATAIHGSDVRSLRFQQVFRGYKAGEVDWALTRLAARIDELEHQLAEARGDAPAPHPPTGSFTAPQPHPGLPSNGTAAPASPHYEQPGSAGSTPTRYDQSGGNNTQPPGYDQSSGNSTQSPGYDQSSGNSTQPPGYNQPGGNSAQSPGYGHPGSSAHASGYGQPTSPEPTPPSGYAQSNPFTSPPTAHPAAWDASTGSAPEDGSQAPVTPQVQPPPPPAGPQSERGAQ